MSRDKNFLISSTQLCWHLSGQTEWKMAKLSDAAVLERAKKLSKEDGFEWDLDLKGPQPEYSKIVLQKLLEPEARQKYLARARQDLVNECGDGA
jgi:hypothetical protein